VVTVPSLAGTFLLIERGVALLEDFTCKNHEEAGSTTEGER
jgi:hypothetical protein